VRSIALIAVLLLAGCGGGDKKPLTAAQWAARADAACGRAADAIAKRGWARDLGELRTRASDAVDDVHAAMAEIRRLPIPAAAANRIRPFVAGLDGLEPVLGDVLRSTTATDLEDLQWTATKLRGRLSTLESTAAGAGLRSCLQDDQLYYAVDGIRAPLVAEQLARVTLRMAERSKTIARLRGDAKLRAIVDTFAEGANSVDALDPPSWVARDVRSYAYALHDLAEVTREARESWVDRDRGLSRPARATIVASVRRVNRLSHRVGRRIGAAPISRGGPG
jgi:hypothetical protein